MKIAVCLTGIMNHYQQGYTLMKPFYEGCDVSYYIHSWSTPSDLESTKDRLYSFFSPVAIRIDPFCDFSDHFGDAELDLKYLKNRNLSNAISWLKSVYEVGKLIEKDEKQYDYVIFSRSDVFASGNSLVRFLPTVNDETIYSSFVHGDQWILDKTHLPDSGAGHIDAKFICSSKSNMVYFSKLYNQLFRYVLDERVPMCHHRLMYHHMKPLIEKYRHSQLWISDQSMNGGWFYIRENGFQGT